MPELEFHRAKDEVLLQYYVTALCHFLGIYGVSSNAVLKLDKKCRKKCPGQKAELNNAAFQDRLPRKVYFKIFAMIAKENNFKKMHTLSEK